MKFLRNKKSHKTVLKLIKAVITRNIKTLHKCLILHVTTA